MGRDKARLKLQDGRTMLEMVIAALEEVCTHVVILGDDLATDDHLHVMDLRASAGPLAGIEALLATGMDSQYLVCPCDVPLITGEVLRTLASAPDQATAAIFKLPSRSQPECLPARIGDAALPVARALLDDDRRAVHKLMSELDAHVIEAPAEFDRLLTNVNTPEEYQALMKER